ncbi:oxidoreductase [Actinoplanes sp. N902-109]|uniref:oxidoreductase n=1 Tax=Actinoplanes sp. (strain N902-109) TaxID=649831 RepID=UPI00032964D1|nr:oxidoreductase [Actinoplanes sp. N902-109]AGL15985.1 oxidoreductase domain-containing protein [Actinoplanes sp. N902-109]
MTTSFVVVGSGFRAAAYWRVAARLDDVSCLGAVVRSPRSLPVPTFRSVAEARPDFVVTAVPKAVNADAVAHVVAMGLPVLTETPATAELAGLIGTGLVQVAEQYLRMPTHAARLALVRKGVIGTPTQVHVSSTQLYHAVSIMRGMLGAGRGPVVVRATRHRAALADPLDRGGWTTDAGPVAATTTLAMLDFGSGRSGLYDFTTNQTRNQLRFRRLLVRGTHGELQDDEVVRLTGTVTAPAIVRTPLTRADDHLAFGADVLFRHPFPGLRFNDDETATATVLRETAAWVRGTGPPPYPLADGIHDTAVGLAIERAADTGSTVTTGA